MKSPILYAFALATLSAPLFMGQAGLTDDGSHSAGGGGFGCSKAKETVATTDTIEGGTETVTPPTETASNEVECPGPVDPINPNADDVCDDRDSYATVKGRDWSEEITSRFGRPVNETCEGECGGAGDHTPWTLSFTLSGTPFSAAKTYSFSFMKDEWKGKVRYLEVKRDPNGADGCLLKEQEPCWKTCGGECEKFETVVKDEKILEADAKSLVVSYLNDVCKTELKVEDFDNDTFGDKLKAAADKATFHDVLFCAQGLLLTASQAVSWIDTASQLGLIRDETGVAYTQDELFRCAKKKIFEGGSKAEPRRSPPETMPAPETAPAPAGP
ncbi:MAG TPA: hypothetical protein VLJ37_02270 [bacterium]|nr:hypothetical protein [bacterium]